MIALLVSGYLSVMPVAPNPRLYVVMHNPYMNEARWDRELALIAELGFGGVRTGFAMPDMIDRQWSGVSDFGRRWVDYSLKRIRDAGLSLHITLADDMPGIDKQVQLGIHSYIMRRAASMFGPDKLTFDIQNEPKAFTHLEAGLVRDLNERANALIRIWVDTGLKARGYALLSPTFHGWFGEWLGKRASPDLKLADSKKLYAARLVTVYGSSIGQWLKSVGVAFNLYAPGKGEDAVAFETEMARVVTPKFRELGGRGQMAITEFGIYPGSGISDDALGTKVAAMAKELLDMRDLRFIAYYCLAGDDDSELISPKGTRREERIGSVKRGFRKAGMLK